MWPSHFQSKIFKGLLQCLWDKVKIDFLIWKKSIISFHLTFYLLNIVSSTRHSNGSWKVSKWNGKGLRVVGGYLLKLYYLLNDLYLARGKFLVIFSKILLSTLIWKVTWKTMSLQIVDAAKQEDLRGHNKWLKDKCWLEGNWNTGYNLRIMNIKLHW